MKSKYKSIPRSVVVLGSLGFIGSAIQLIYAIFKIFEGSFRSYLDDSSIQLMKETDELMHVTEFEHVNKLSDNAISIGIINIISVMFCIVGIIWMWKLRKKGFYVYIIGELIPHLGFILLMGLTYFGLWDAIYLGVSIFLILLWSLNLRYMN